MTENIELSHNPEIENQKEKSLENNIGSFSETINLGSVAKFPMSGDKVYRSVHGDKAIDDIFESGMVRNAKSRGLGGKGRDNQVYWTRGEDNKDMGVGKDRRIIEAPLNIAELRLITKEDVTAIYELSENNEVKNSLPEREAAIEAKNKAMADEKVDKKQIQAELDSKEIEEIRAKLEIDRTLPDNS